MHSKKIPDTLWELLNRLNNLSDIRAVYLGGGTGLAFQLGHRRSDDLDFYMPEDFDFYSFMVKAQREGLTIKIMNRTTRHIELTMQSVKVDFIKEMIPLKYPLRPFSPDIQNIRFADPRDIGRMKIIAIGSRGSKKDFIDIYCLSREIIGLETLITMAMGENEGVRYSKLLFLKGLVDFEEADREADPSMIWDVPWEEVKQSLETEIRKIAEKMKGD